MQLFIVYQPNFSKPAFTLYARSLAQARAVVAAMIAGEVIVVAVKGARR